MTKRPYKNYTVNDNYFKMWSHDMAYILGFIVADGCLRNDGYYVKVEVKPDDISLLEFICREITPNYQLKHTDRGTEVRWYPSSKVLKKDLMGLGVIPRKTGKEVVPEDLPDKYLWDFIRGYFDGDGSVEDCCVSITCNSLSFLEELREKTRLGRKPSLDRMNYRWIIEEKCNLREFHNKLYATGKFHLERKKKLMDNLVNWVPEKIGRFSLSEDQFILNNYSKLTRREIAVRLGRKACSVKNRLKHLRARKEGVPFVA